MYTKDPFKPPYQRPTNSLTTEEDFQSIEKEVEQNRTIETPGISKIRMLLQKDSKFGESDLEILLRWISLHSIRNHNSRNALFASKDVYEEEFDPRLEVEHKYFKQIDFCDIYTTSGNQYFITSDDPVLEIEISGKYCFILPLSPSKAVLLSSHGQRLTHSSLSFPESVNSMLYGGCAKEVYSDRNDVSTEMLEMNLRTWNMTPKLETMTFSNFR